MKQLVILPTKVKLEKIAGSGWIIISQQRPDKHSQDVIALKGFTEYDKAEDWFARFTKMLAE